MTVFELAAKLTLDSSEYEKGLKGASKTANEWAKKLDKGVDKLIKVGSVAAGAAAAGLVAFGRSAVQAGMSFDKSMSQVAATMGMTNDEITDLRDFAKKMGAQTKFSATEAADALNYMALAGYDADTAMKMLPGVLNLAAAGNMDLARASDMVTDSQSALGLSMDETTDLVDKMAMASSKSNTSVEQLGDAILTVGGTAKNLSGGTTELSTALGILADNGVKGAEGGTALRNIILSLSAPTDVAAKKLKSLGVSVYDSEGNMRSLNEIFGDLDTSMAGLTDEQRMEALSTIFNNRDLKSAEALLANHGDRWNELSGYIDNSAGAAQKMANTQLDNLNGDLTIMNSALEGAKIAFSDGITPSLRKVVQMVTKALSNPKTTKFLKETGEKLGELAEKLAEWASNAIPKVINLFSNGAPKVKTFGVAVAGIVLAIKAVTNPIGALVSGLGILGGAFAAAQLGAESYREKYGGLNDAEREGVDASIDAAASYNALKDSRDAAFKSVDQETAKTQALWAELQTLVDENGNVTEGNEARAKQITDELNNALGTQFNWEGDILTNYQEQSAAIDELIKKRSALLKLEIGEETYKTALENLGATQTALYDAGQEVDRLKERYDIFAGNLAALEEAGIGGVSRRQAESYASTAEEEYNAAKDRYDTLLAAEKDYYADIDEYQRAERAAMEGHYDEVNEIFDNSAKNRAKAVVESGNITEAQLADLEKKWKSAEDAAERHAQGVLENLPGYSVEDYIELKNAAEEWKKMYNEALASIEEEASDTSIDMSDAIDETSLKTAAEESGAAAGAAVDDQLTAAMKSGAGELYSTARQMGIGLMRSIVAGVKGGRGVSYEGYAPQAIGLDYVPYDGYPAMLHHGEAVLNANEADDWRRGRSGSGRGQVVNNFTFNGVSRSDLDMIVGVVNRELGFA